MHVNTNPNPNPRSYSNTNKYADTDLDGHAHANTDSHSHSQTTRGCLTFTDSRDPRCHAAALSPAARSKREAKRIRPVSVARFLAIGVGTHDSKIVREHNRRW